MVDVLEPTNEFLGFLIEPRSSSWMEGTDHAQDHSAIGTPSVHGVVGGCLRAALRALGSLAAALPPHALARAQAAEALLEAAEGDLWSPAPTGGGGVPTR